MLPVVEIKREDLLKEVEENIIPFRYKDFIDVKVESNKNYYNVILRVKEPIISMMMSYLGLKDVKVVRVPKNMYSTSNYEELIGRLNDIRKASNDLYNTIWAIVTSLGEVVHDKMKRENKNES